MAKTSVIVGVILIVLALAFYAATGFESQTALIPGGFGILILICGLLAKKESRRKHAMHAAAVVALLGVLGGFGMGLPKLLKGDMARPIAVYEQLIMGAICIVFLILCIRSFVAARRARA